MNLDGTANGRPSGQVAILQGNSLMPSVSLDTEKLLSVTLRKEAHPPKGQRGTDGAHHHGKPTGVVEPTPIIPEKSAVSSLVLPELKLFKGGQAMRHRVGYVKQRQDASTNTAGMGIKGNSVGASTGNGGTATEGPSTALVVHEGGAVTARTGSPRNTALVPISARNTMEKLALLTETSSLGRKYGAGEKVAETKEIMAKAHLRKQLKSREGTGTGKGGSSRAVAVGLTSGEETEGAASGDEANVTGKAKKKDDGGPNQEDSLAGLGAAGVIATWPSGGGGGMIPALLQHLQSRIHSELTVMHHSQGQDRETLAAMRSELLLYIISTLGRHFRTYKEVFEFLYSSVEGLQGLFDFHQDQIREFREAEVTKEKLHGEALHQKDLVIEDLRAEIAKLKDVAERFGPLEEDRKVLRALSEDLQRQVTRQKNLIESLNERLDTLSRQHVTNTIKEDRLKAKLEASEKEIAQLGKDLAEMVKGRSDALMKMESALIVTEKAGTEVEAIRNKCNNLENTIKQLTDEVKILRFEKKRLLLQINLKPGEVLDNSSLILDGLGLAMTPRSFNQLGAGSSGGSGGTGGAPGTAERSITPRPNWKRIDGVWNSLFGPTMTLDQPNVSSASMNVASERSVGGGAGVGGVTEFLAAAGEVPSTQDSGSASITPRILTQTQSAVTAWNSASSLMSASVRPHDMPIVSQQSPASGGGSLQHLSLSPAVIPNSALSPRMASLKDDRQSPRNVGSLAGMPSGSLNMPSQAQGQGVLNPNLIGTTVDKVNQMLWGLQEVTASCDQWRQLATAQKDEILALREIVAMLEQPTGSDAAGSGHHHPHRLTSPGGGSGAPHPPPGAVPISAGLSAIGGSSASLAPKKPKSLHLLEDKHFVPCGLSVDVPRFLQAPEESPVPIRFKPLTLAQLLDQLDAALQYIAEEYIKLTPSELSTPNAIQKHLDAASEPEGLPGCAPMSFAEGLYRWLCVAHPHNPGEGGTASTQTASPTKGTSSSSATATNFSAGGSNTGPPTSPLTAPGSPQGVVTASGGSGSGEPATIVQRHSLDTAYSLIYLAQHTYSSNIYCRMFLYQLSGEIPMATFLYHRLHFRSLRAIFEAQDPNAIQQVELTETLAAAKKQLKYLSDYDIKVLTEAAQFKSIMNAGGGLARHKSFASGAGPLSSNQSSAAPNPKLGGSGPGATSARTLPGVSRQRLVSFHSGDKDGADPAANQPPVILVRYPALFTRDHPFAQAHAIQFLSTLLYNQLCLRRSLNELPFTTDSLPLQVVQQGLASADSQWTTDGVRAFIATCLQKRVEELGPKTKVNVSLLHSKLRSVFLKRCTPMNVGLFNLDSADPPDFPQLSLLTAVPEPVVDTVASAGSAGGEGGNPQGSRNQKPVVAQAASSANLKSARKKSKA
jgi:hypothetical protein